MNLKWTPEQILERVIAGSFGILIIAVIVLLVLSVTRQSGLDDELQGSIEDLQQTTAELEETVEQLRSTTDDPEILTDLDTIDERLQAVDERLEFLEENIEEPLFGETALDSASSTGGAEANTQEVQQGFDAVFTTVAWLIGILSIVTAVALAFVLHERNSKKRRQKLAVHDTDGETA